MIPAGSCKGFVTEDEVRFEVVVAHHVVAGIDEPAGALRTFRREQNAPRLLAANI